MNIDSCTFEVPECYIKPNKEKFTEVSKTNQETGEIQTYYEAKNISSGLSSLLWLPGKGIVTVGLSGKILPIDHKQLINLNNFDEVVQNLNKTGFVNAECAGMFESSIVRKVDFTENLFTQNINDYLNAVKSINHHLRFIKDIYPDSTVFRGTFTTKKERLTVYDKQIETKNPFYNGILRFESQRTTFQSIKDDVNASNSLSGILTSKEKPVLKLFSKISGLNQSNINLYSMAQNTAGMTEFMYEVLLQTCNDMQSIKLILQQNSKSRATVCRHLKALEIYEKNRNKIVSNVDFIKEIIYQLAS